MLRQLSGASRTVTAVHRQIAAQLGLATKSRGLLDAARHQIARELVALAEAGQLLSHIHSPSPQPPASTPEQEAPQLSPDPNPAAVQAQLIGAVVVVPPEQFGMVGGPPFHGVVTLPHKRKGALPGEAWEVVYTDDTRTYWHPAAEILSWHQAALATFPAAPQPSPRQRQPEPMEQSSPVTQHSPATHRAHVAGPMHAPPLPPSPPAPSLPLGPPQQAPLDLAAALQQVQELTAQVAALDATVELVFYGLVIWEHPVLEVRRFCDCRLGVRLQRVILRRVTTTARPQRGRPNTVVVVAVAAADARAIFAAKQWLGSWCPVSISRHLPAQQRHHEQQMRRRNTRPSAHTWAHQPSHMRRPPLRHTPVTLHAPPASRMPPHAPSVLRRPPLPPLPPPPPPPPPSPPRLPRPPPVSPLPPSLPRAQADPACVPEVPNPPFTRPPFRGPRQPRHRQPSRRCRSQRQRRRPAPPPPGDTPTPTQHQLPASRQNQQPPQLTASGSA